ncbi:uncharacterized protein ACOB8E_007662 isoform 1-T1 [Sarcophilus harrisii]
MKTCIRTAQDNSAELNFLARATYHLPLSKYRHTPGAARFHTWNHIKTKEIKITAKSHTRCHGITSLMLWSSSRMKDKQLSVLSILGALTHSLSSDLFWQRTRNDVTISDLGSRAWMSPAYYRDTKNSRYGKRERATIESQSQED